MTTTHSSHETMGSMAATLKMPYTLTPGRATGIFLAALAQQQILGSRCTACSTVRVPAQDVCPDCGGESPEIVRVPETGVLEAWTQTDQGVIALVRLDGTATRLIHTVGGLSAESAREGGVRPGSRVQAVWSDRTTGSLSDIEYFRVLGEGE